MRIAFAFIVGLLIVSPSWAAGLLIPEDRKLPPLAMVHHRVNIAIEDQVAVTTVEQAFRNHTDRQLEATYLFPIPKGASVNKFSMWIDGKEVNGELLDAKKANSVYTEIVRRTQDPAILEYLGNNLMRLKIFPVLPKVDQKVKLSFTSVAPQDAGVIEYIYPLKTDGKATRTLEDFTVNARIKSQHPIQNVYSPTHALSIQRDGDRQVTVRFERDQATLDKDFQLFYSVGNKEIGITPLTYRPISSEEGYFLLLISPQLESSKNNTIPRDLVLVLDTSGSMDSVKMDQARRALKHCLTNLRPVDRFSIISFSTGVRSYRDTLVEANAEQIENAKKWVDSLKAGGGTAIQLALDSAVDLRSKDEGRSFTVAFFTDGQPTIGEMNVDKIVKNVAKKNSENTRVFTFGVGNDVNTALLDQIADNSKAISTYVRPAEDIEAKVSSLYSKISHPVLANVKMIATENLKVHEVYPTQLPDLFYGTQLVVLGKYSGRGAGAIRIVGQVGKESREFAYDVNFPDRTTEERDFVENLWARRKVGFLLDQIRLNGEQKELMDEMLPLARKYGIATPYTSYLVVPDAPMPVAASGGRMIDPITLGLGGNTSIPPGGISGFAGSGGSGGGIGGFAGGGPGFAPTAPGLPSVLGELKGLPKGPGGPKVEDAARALASKPATEGRGRGTFESEKLEKMEKTLEALDKKIKDERLAGKADPAKATDDTVNRGLKMVQEARAQNSNFMRAKDYLNSGKYKEAQVGEVGVDLAVCANNLRQQDRLTPTANRQIQGRNCLEIGGLWMDDAFQPDMKTVVVKAQSEAYFRILEKYPKMKDVFRLGNHLVFVLPSKLALIIDLNNGKEKLTDEEIDAMFVEAKGK